MTKAEGPSDFLFVFAFGAVSLLELRCLLQRTETGKFKSHDLAAAVVSCTEKEALALLSKLGGTNKVARIHTSDLNESIKSIILPERPKFSWSVSGYGCNSEMLLEARQELHMLLKQEGLGKSKFLQPLERASGQATELDVIDVRKRIFSPQSGPGIELVVYCSRGDLSHPIYAETIETVELEGFERRDFARPYQDPTKTLSPRLGRVLVNLALSNTPAVLDPFCGLGTTLAEALVLGCDVVGTDRSSENIEKSRQNLRWVESEFSIRARSVNLFAYDARRISHASMPRIGAIATEPILLPTYTQNPSRQQASLDLSRAKEKYAKCLFEFAKILPGKGARVAFTSPSLFDSSGSERRFSLEEEAREAGFRPYFAGFEDQNLNYPLKLDLQKKRIVHRNFNVYELG